MLYKLMSLHYIIFIVLALPVTSCLARFSKEMQ
jgi:hypothetical protein